MLDINKASPVSKNIIGIFIHRSVESCFGRGVY
jgi:hypothetical protein